MREHTDISDTPGLLTEMLSPRMPRRVPVRDRDLSATDAHPDTGFAYMRDGRRVICL